MNEIARGVFEDLKQRRLLPVVGVLLLALVAVPVLLRDKGEAPVAPATTGAAAATASVDGLPSPESVLNGGGKPLVTLAVLKDPSNLDSFESKNPFKPLREMTGAKAAAPSSTGQTSPAASQSASGGGGGSTGGTGGSGTGGGGTSTPSPTTPTTPSTTTTTPQAPNESTPKTADRKLTYAMDLSFRTPGSNRTYRSVAKLRMLPSQSSPLFIYLGVDGTGTKAVFLVDSTLTVVSGEGTCKPTNASCATVEIGPGEVSRFQDGSGKQYELEVDQLRLVPAKKAAASAARAARAQAARRAGATSAPRRRFVPPVITDLFVGAAR